MRALSKHTRSLSRSLQTPNAPTQTRAFHSPFALLSQTQTSPLEQPPQPTSNHTSIYEKQNDHLSDPFLSGSGQRTYVVSQPDPSNTPYEVPSGAYPTSAPYQNYVPTEPIKREPDSTSSTSSAFAHPFTTRAVPQNEKGVGDSAAVRYREAPGEQDKKGGSYGGIGLMDSKTTKAGEGQLGERNPAPDRPEVAKKFSDAGVDNAWKERK